MPDQIHRILGAILANLRIVMFVVLGVMLLFVLYLYYSPTGQVPTGPGGRGGGQGNIEIDNEAMQQIVQRWEVNEAPIEESEAAILVSDSMFSVKAIRDAMDQEKQANAKFEQAVTARRNREYARAHELLQEVLAIRPNHHRARQLMTEIEKLLNMQ